RNQLTGTGRGGRITKQDVIEHTPDGTGASPERERPEVESQPPVAQRPASGYPTGSPRETRQRLSAIRRRIAQRLVESQLSTASLTTFNEADLSAVNALRARYKDRFKEKHGAALGFMSFFIKACVEGLKTYPLVNA